MADEIAYDEHQALEAAVEAAKSSPCAKTKRGAVIFLRPDSLYIPAIPVFGVYARGHNGPPRPFLCAGTPACHSACTKICVHAEAHALLRLTHTHLRRHYLYSHLEMLHVEIVDGKPVPSGPPSCWQCSRLILHAGISTVWLLHSDGLRSYSAHEFHLATLRTCGLPLPESEEGS